METETRTYISIYGEVCVRTRLKSNTSCSIKRILEVVFLSFMIFSI